ncbi:diguanylate cyclase [Alishewanella sp. SMS8]|uniref:GGDEF domain-containing protein n=1 Tax=Alishewanella sp. SMS8 TaxID=2994676 RepID=UPI00274196AB|nr:GGDEF domain-containing protein [Alishewanella sp. SMS8]MDP4945014.1 GGDEF domain-containing protein [Alishewanella sp.]MDP5187594.1 GGDEF domain-containing protein [Alishewanella sp.]MDP5458241.1 GGDEF domain-containing protein [Alishewanella sp. SMS8]
MHLPTVVILALVINLIVGFYLYLLYRRKPKDRCFRLWSFSSISFVLGGTLVALRPYDITAFFTFFVADCLLLLAPILVLAGLIQFSRFRYTRRRRQHAFVLLALIVIALLSVYHHPGILSVLVALAIGITFYLCAVLLQKSVITEPTFTRTLQGIFLLHALTMFTQVMLILWQWQSLDMNGLPESSVYTLLSHILLTTFTALLLPWLCFLKLERKLTLKSQRDGLTKLANREHFFNLVERYWQQQRPLPAVLMMIDIDFFKKINDKFGHAVGDSAIKAVAQLLSKQLRCNDIIGRIGGEEYAALLIDLDEATALKISQRLCEQVEKQLQFVADAKVELTISIGLVYVDTSQHDYVSALKAADEALYSSKRAGRNTVTLGAVGL